jgi:hypothetical protein
MDEVRPEPTPGSETDHRVVSYHAIRQLVGLLGFAVPSALLIYASGDWGGRMQPSISEFYYTPMGDVFVAGLAMIAVFLFAYRGHRRRPGDPWPGDRLTAILAAAGALGTAVIPTTGSAVYALCYGPLPVRCETDAALGSGAVTGWGPLPDSLQDALHFGSAGIFLLTLAWFCLRLFPLGPRHNRVHPEEEPTKTEGYWARREALYRACGWIIVATVAVLFLYKVVLGMVLGIEPGWIDRIALTFWLETLAVFAFATAWLVKGRPIEHPLGR